MNIDGYFSENSIIAENLSLLMGRESAIYEARICELSSLASDAADTVIDMLESGCGIYEALYFIFEGIGEGSILPHEDHLEENYSRLKTHLGLIGAFDKFIFSDLLSAALTKKGKKLSEGDFLLELRGNGVISFVKNPLADEAFDVFSQEIEDIRLKYSQSLLDAAKAVSSGETEFALLPLEERGGSRLSSIMELIFKEDLRIASVTPVFGFEGDADMKYALVSKNFILPTIEDGDDRYLEIRLRNDSATPISDLFIATNALNVDIYRINTISFETDEGQTPYYSIVFRDEGGDFSGLLLYLTLFYSGYTTIGLYKNLE